MGKLLASLLQTAEMQVKETFRPVKINKTKHFLCYRTLQESAS